MSITCDFCKRPIEGRYVRYDDGRCCCTSCKSRLPPCKLCGVPVVGAAEVCARCETDAVRCGVCHTLIVGRYYADEEAGELCPACHERLPRCTSCGRAFVEGSAERGEPFCRRCVAEALRCDLCGRICAGKYWTHPTTGTVCRECHDHAPRCVRCSAPMRAAGPEGMCSSCWQSAEHCWACGNVLSKQFYTHAAAPGRKFCPECIEKRDQCDFCSLPVVAGGTVYPDGRLSCPGCRSTAVLDPRELAEIEQSARGWLTQRVGLTLRPAEQCPTRLASADDIARLQSKRFVATPGFDRRERGLFMADVVEHLRGDQLVRRDETLAIYVEGGLPRAEAYGTMVHELCHLWQLDHFPKGNVDRRYVEGLACWLQHHALEGIGADAQARRVAENPDPVYGGGFRMVAEIEKRVGSQGTIPELLRQLGR